MATKQTLHLRGLLRKTSTIVAYLLAGLIRLIGGIVHWWLVA
jgi:hypothetical protein